MVFSSLLFTVIFLPLVLVLYFLAQERFRNVVLLCASFLFYGYGEPRFVFVLALSIAVNYLLALLIDRFRSEKARSRLFLCLAVLLNVGLLFIFKYLGFTLININRLFHTSFHKEIALPIGISFFTFQSLSYVIDVYRGVAPVQKKPLDLALYVSFFPQLIAGPIVRYNTIAEQIRHRQVTEILFAEGIKRFFTGFAKKVILANHLAVIADELFTASVNAPLPAIYAWLGAICYSLQIFYDFAGYSDMAIGLGRMFGFTFEENFRYPYISASITEFWRRWHISLGTWFRDYVYIPLGGSRKGPSRQIINLFIVWALTGIWHGANWTFLAWGLFYFVLLVLEKVLVHPTDKPFAFRLLWRVFSLFSVICGWVVFRAASLTEALRYLLSMFSASDTSVDLWEHHMPYYLREYGVYLFFSILFATPIAGLLSRALERFRITRTLRYIVLPLLYGLLYVWAFSFIILGVHNPFIYFNF